MIERNCQERHGLDASCYKCQETFLHLHLLLIQNLSVFPASSAYKRFSSTWKENKTFLWITHMLKATKAFSSFFLDLLLCHAALWISCKTCEHPVVNSQTPVMVPSLLKQTTAHLLRDSTWRLKNNLLAFFGIWLSKEEEKRVGQDCNLAHLKHLSQWVLMHYVTCTTKDLPFPFSSALFIENISQTLRSYWWCSVVLCHSFLFKGKKKDVKDLKTIPQRKCRKWIIKHFIW